MRNLNYPMIVMAVLGVVLPNFFMLLVFYYAYATEQHPLLYGFLAMIYFAGGSTVACMQRLYNEWIKYDENCQVTLTENSSSE